MPNELSIIAASCDRLTINQPIRFRYQDTTREIIIRMVLVSFYVESKEKSGKSVHDKIIRFSLCKKSQNFPQFRVDKEKVSIVETHQQFSMIFEIYIEVSCDVKFSFIEEMSKFFNYSKINFSWWIKGEIEMLHGNNVLGCSYWRQGKQVKAVAVETL